MIRNIAVISRRELLGYLRSPMGYAIAAMFLAIDGLLFNSFVLGSGKRLSSEVISQFFYLSSGMTVVACTVLSMRLFAEERQMGTLVLLRTAPLSDAEVVLGKFFAAWAFMALVLALSVPMPLLVMVHGKVSVGHLLAGYGGLLLLAAMAVSIGTFGSAVAGSQVAAAVISAAILALMVGCYHLSSRVPLGVVSDVLSHMSWFHKHFQSFMRGILNTRDVVFYATVSYLFLFLSTHVLRTRRWT